MFLFSSRPLATFQLNLRWYFRSWVTKGGGVRLALALLFVIVVIMIARTSSTHCEALLANGTYDRRGCE